MVPYTLDLPKILINELKFTNLEKGLNMFDHGSQLNSSTPKNLIINVMLQNVNPRLNPGPVLKRFPS